ncbi:protein O-GlcNAcase [Lapidilactobacillus gannanensis]|uniref:Protein O-GlcNAcase n=1 Tax=Lapidilactobacillus gannanensis TaxID=2486002 RepID=A0ABW4BKR5_9LACO|nr:protein O-GlcNAcase [Lapidilactobacillus gannanensis]
MRGLRYANELLEKLIISKSEDIICPVATVIQDSPIQIRGVIEGFYGQPWSHKNRLNVIDYLGCHRMNTYMYAPKDDVYQRKEWRKLYPVNLQDEFSELQERCLQEQIDFYYMISPGNDICLSDDDDVSILCEKLQQMIDLGFTHFGLLFDDIDYHLKGRALVKFSTAANAHANLANQVNSYLKEKLSSYKLVICPTEYDNAEGTVYLSELTEKLAPEVMMFWTGPSTLASQISTYDLRVMAQVYQRKMIIWDNVPVNDFQNDAERLFLSPYRNRTPHINNDLYNVAGIVSNPMPEWESSKITIGTMSDYLWNPSRYRPQESFLSNLEDLIPKPLYSSFLLFASFNKNRFMQNDYQYDQINMINRNSVDEITNVLKNLMEVSIKLQTGVESSPLLKEMLPWLMRPAKDLELWNAIVVGNKNQVTYLKNRLASDHHRMGTDLVAKYIQKYSIQ